MTELEAIEYRIKRNRVRNELGVGLLLVAIALSTFGASYTTEHPTPVFISILLTIAAMGLMWKAEAMRRDSWYRQVWTNVFDEPPDPPLDDWEQELERRGAFGGGFWEGHNE